MNEILSHFLLSLRILRLAQRTMFQICFKLVINTQKKKYHERYLNSWEIVCFLANGKSKVMEVLFAPLSAFLKR